MLLERNVQTFHGAWKKAFSSSFIIQFADIFEQHVDDWTKSEKWNIRENLQIQFLLLLANLSHRHPVNKRGENSINVNSIECNKQAETRPISSNEIDCKLYFECHLIFSLLPTFTHLPPLEIVSVWFACRELSSCFVVVFSTRRMLPCNISNFRKASAD